MTFVFKGKSSTLAVNTEKYKKADALLKAGKEKELIDLLYTHNRIQNLTKGEFTVDSKAKTITETTTNEKLHPVLAKKLVNFSFNNHHYNAFKNFLKNVNLNPDPSSVEQLYHFLEHNHFPITSDGCFLAYKSVLKKENDKKLVDHHTGKFDNSIGQTVKMLRENCDSRRDVTCSYGLHVAAFTYAHDFRGNSTIIEVKVNPKDVVSVPNDYNNQKMRVCEYYVIKEGSSEIKQSYLSQKYIAGKVDYKDKEKSTIDESMTAKQIIDFIKEKTGHLIAISLKSKKSIIQKANKILAELSQK
jgi:hypothetical protein